MSRIGKKPIQIPSEVTIEIKDNLVIAKGPKGELSYETRPEINVEQVDGTLVCEMNKEFEPSKKVRAFWGLTRALISNMIIGVSEGFERKLELVGVGYRATADPKGVSFTLGYSHPVVFEKPEGIEIVVEDNKNVIVRGIDKQLVSQTAAKIRELRKPEPYKGKGIRYSDELVRTKPGKAGKI